jgi:hypothetical protein
MEESSATHCIACHAPISGPYCAQCGESAVRQDYSVKHLAAELVESVTELDGRTWRTFRALLFQPGVLARDFLAGHRKRQFGPVKVFLICNLVYFLAQPLTLFAPFTSTLRIQTTARLWSGMAREIVGRKLAAHGQTFEQYGAVYDATAHLQGKTLVLLMVPLFALGAWVLYGRTRRFYAEHLVPSFYTYGFLLLWFAAGTVALTAIFRAGLALGLHFTGDGLEAVSTPVMTLPFFVYLLLSDRKVYGESWTATSLKAVLLTGWAAAALTAYRFVLFFTALYAT